MAFTQQNLSSDTATDVDTSLSGYVPLYADADHSEFAVAGTTPPNRDVLSIRHTTGKDGELRSVVRIDYTDDDALGNIATGSVYLNIVQPNNSTFTVALMKQLVNRLVDFCVEGGSNDNISKLLNREV
jgi:hypothetical protein